MSKFATLDSDDSAFNVGDQENSNEEILDRLENDTDFQKDLSRQGQAQQVNLALAQEIYSILTEMEGQYFDVSQNERYINWENTDIPYQVLRRAGTIEAARLIKNKRRLDLAQYGKPPRMSAIQRGSHLIFPNPDYSPTKEEKIKVRQWEQRIFKNFFFAANDVYPNFAKFLGNAYEDWFDVDDITVEIRRDGLGTPLAIQLQDPILWKPVIKRRRSPVSLWQERDAVLESYLEDYEKMILGDDAFLNKHDAADEEPDYLLIYQNNRIAAGYRDFIRKFHFFTRSDFRKAQRGYSVVEQGLNIATYITNSIRMNASNFSNNRLPKGFVAFTGGGVGTLQLEKLKKILYAHMSGTTPNRFPMIGLNGDKGDAKWVNIGGNSKDMEYHLWITLLFSIYCQLSGTDPREISLGAHSDAIKKQSLGEESTDGIIKESTDRGLRTFLSHVQDSLNTPNSHGENVFKELTGMDVELEFVGFEIEDKKMKYEIRTKELATTKSINMLLAEDDEEKQTLMLGDKNVYDIVGISNPQLYQVIIQASQQGAQPQPGQQGSPQPGQQPGAPQGDNKEEQYTQGDKALIEKYGQPKNNFNKEG